MLRRGDAAFLFVLIFGEGVEGRVHRPTIGRPQHLLRSEIKILRTLPVHRNLVQLHDVTTELDESVQMVFEFLESDLEMVISVRPSGPRLCLAALEL